MGPARLRMAVPKGSLLGDTLAVLEGAGFGVAGLADSGRKLIVDADDVRYIIAKPTDVPAYAAYGAADVAVCGKDVLDEQGLDVVELADLGFGACRFVVAERDDAAEEVAEHYAHLGVVRVATKYPRVAERHYASKGVQAEIVKLHGNIEVACAIGLADQVVDITATGRTLSENGLRVVEEISRSTARFVANPVSMRIDTARITDMADRLMASARRLEDPEA